ncbi:MAG: 2Fe-2S iron-sulfur cluster binding domain-containing protein [Chlorobiota bacterium]|jgi:ferredoxin|nr:2Fe-2S iron-sulfur cluster binding domain-containing protein [Chlorobiota bacterium]QQS65608.1 MAG: 2Fe-2S iron-sulfur cluster binding domain-containing protein [Chlorobiota bacterium]
MKIPGFSFWALATGAIVFLLLIGVGMETPTAIIISSIWYILGVGSAYAIYKYHHPELDVDEFSFIPKGYNGPAPEGMCAVTFTNQARVAYITKGANLREAAKKQFFPIHFGVTTVTNCFGNGFCGTCRITPDSKTSKNLSDVTWKEKFTLGSDAGKIRLACQCYVNNDCIISNNIAKEFSESHKFTVINGALIGLFSLIMLGVLLWMGGDMISLF